MLRNLGYYLYNRNIADFVLNRIVQWRNPDLKVFFVGYNKTATSAIFHFLARQGVKSAHWQQGRANLALEIERRVGSPAELKKYLSQWTAYSDLTLSSDHQMLEGNRHFRLFHQLFPDAYFILNDRDPERWVASRIAHRGGQFAARSAAFHDCTAEEVREIWLREREEHHLAVLSYFADYPRFLHFRVDRDDISDLIRFLSPFRLKRHHWSEENVSGRR